MLILCCDYIIVLWFRKHPGMLPVYGCAPPSGPPMAEAVLLPGGRWLIAEWEYSCISVPGEYISVPRADTRGFKSSSLDREAALALLHNSSQCESGIAPRWFPTGEQDWTGYVSIPSRSIPSGWFKRKEKDQNSVVLQQNNLCGPRRLDRHHYQAGFAVGGSFGVWVDGTHSLSPRLGFDAWFCLPDTHKLQ